jgi:hypothetical protein
VSDVRVEVDLARFYRSWGAAVTKQIPFAVAAGCTRLAKMGHADVYDRMGRVFTLRSDWTRKGLRVKPAEKRDWPRTTAWVYHRDRGMVKQELGETKKPKGEHIAIPTRLARGGSERGRIRKAMRPGPVIARGAAKPTQDEIVRTPKRSTPDLRILYLLRKSAKVKPRFGMRETVERTVRANQKFVVLDEFRKAVRPKT